MFDAEHTQRKRSELKEQYDLLSERIVRIRRELAIVTDVAERFRLEQQLAADERERDRLVAAITATDSAEGELPVSPYLEAVVARLEALRHERPHDLQENLLDFYVEPRGATEPPGSDAQPQPIWQLLEPALAAGRPCIVLAEFGMGKSWLLRMIQHRLARAGGAPTIPLLVKLRDFEPQILPPDLVRSMPAILAAMGVGKSPSIERTLLEQLRDRACALAFGAQTARARRAAIDTLAEQGRFLLLLDALDETPGTSRATAESILREAGAQAEATARSPILITCRRSYFTDAAQEQSLRERGLSVFYLWPWADDELGTYLRYAHAAGMVPEEPQAALARITSVVSLRDISSRALLTAMLVEQWAYWATQAQVDIPSLYEHFVERRLLAWQSGKAKQLETHQLRAFMDELAFLMFQLNRLALSPAEMDEYFKAKFAEFQVERFSEIAAGISSDIRTNSFLLREGEQYVFCHASVWEFLVARRLYQALEQGDEGPFLVSSRSSQYRSVMQNFLLPMLRRDGKLNLAVALIARP